MRKKTLTRQIGVLLTDETYNKLTRLTDIREIPISEFIRKMTITYLDHIERKGGLENDSK